MSEYMPAQDSAETPNEVTLVLANDQSINVAPHNTQLVEFDGPDASRNHIYFYSVTEQVDFQDIYLFRTFDPETYGTMRQHILANLAYRVALSDEVNPAEERAYQQQVDQRVATWRKSIPDTSLEFLITISK